MACLKLRAVFLIHRCSFKIYMTENAQQLYALLYSLDQEVSLTPLSLILFLSFCFSPFCHIFSDLQPPLLTIATIFFWQLLICICVLYFQVNDVKREDQFLWVIEDGKELKESNILVWTGLYILIDSLIKSEKQKCSILIGEVFVGIL